MDREFEVSDDVLPLAADWLSPQEVLNCSSDHEALVYLSE